MIIHTYLYILNISKARHGQEFAIYLFLKQKDDKQTCFCQPSRMSHYGELPDVICQKIAKKNSRKS